MTSQELPGPALELRFRRRVSLRTAIRAVWRSRELILTLAERDLRARYKQTYLGAVWALILPLALMVVFTLFLQRVAEFDTKGAPYPLFAYVGLIPWSYFSSCVTIGGQSLTANTSLLNKVYCPREIFPMASLLVAGFDMLLSVLVLGVLFVVLSYAPAGTALWAVPLLAIQVMFTLAVTLMVSAILVYLRDLRQALPILLQLGLFATPVAYGMNIVPKAFRPAYSVLNPLAPVIDGYRRAILFGQHPEWALTGLAAVSAVVMLVVGYLLFKRMETGFADVA